MGKKQEFFTFPANLYQFRRKFPCDTSEEAADLFISKTLFVPPWQMVFMEKTSRAARNPQKSKKRAAFPRGSRKKAYVFRQSVLPEGKTKGSPVLAEQKFGVGTVPPVPADQDRFRGNASSAGRFAAGHPVPFTAGAPFAVCAVGSAESRHVFSSVV